MIWKTLTSYFVTNIHFIEIFMYFIETVIFPYLAKYREMNFNDVIKLKLFLNLQKIQRP